MMTLIDTTAARTKPADRFLRNALRFDAIASAIMGASFVAAPGLQQDMYGLPPALTLPVGIALVGFAAAVWFTSARPRVNTAAVWSIVGLNVWWIAGSVTVIAAGWLPLTPLGLGFVALQAAAVALFSVLEFLGLRRIQRNAS